ncbi:MAG: hypothetical protein GY929_15865 [Actinomycetia bacterium]|nr:hypothetical protein [Actinomycetes bacterium]
MASDRLRIIYDADLGPDPCDFSTVSMLHEYHARGLIELVACIGETPDPDLASSFAVYNRLHGNDIPIGAPVDGGPDLSFEERGRKVYDDTLERTTHRRQNEVIRERYGDSTTNDQRSVPPVECYRRILAANHQRDIVIFAAGPLYNLPALLESEPDDISPLTGEELVARSVGALQIMGGAFPSSAEIIGNPMTDGAEWNFWALDTPGVTAVTIDRLTTLGIPMTFVGYEVGRPVKVGREVIRRLGRQHPTSESFFQYVFTAKDGLELTAENAAFDEVALFHLVEGKTGDWFGEVEGRPLIEAGGVNTWTADGPHRYLTLRAGAEVELVGLITDRITGHDPD